MTIRQLSQKDKRLIGELAKLHKKAFPDFFLTQLGLPFLRTLYRGYLDDPESGIIVAVENRKLAGFVAYSNDYPRFYKGLVKKKIIQFVWCSFLAALRHPSFTKRLLGALKKSEAVEKKEKYVELASICVDPETEGKGIGTKLVNRLKKQVDFDIYSYINLETDADHNDKANGFYVKNGFTLYRTYMTNEGRRMNEYRYSQETLK